MDKKKIKVVLATISLYPHHKKWIKASGINFSWEIQKWIDTHIEAEGKV